MQKQKLLALEEALSRVTGQIQPTTFRIKLPISECLNRVAAEDQFAPIEQPPFANSAVDGYAFNMQDLLDLKKLPVKSRIPAGAAPSILSSGEAARIFTGAPVPKGANCVLMQESADISAVDHETFLSTNSTLSLNQNIRPAGQDFSEGQVLVRRGDVLRPQSIALLASAGIASIDVFKPLRVAVISTGDELAKPGMPLKPGQIYNSNQYLLGSLLQSFGVEVINLPLVADTFEACKSALEEAASADLIISSGGASVGEEDHIKPVIEALGKVDFWRIAIKPGKPFMCGQVQGTPILGLPGNPSAVLVTFLILARKVLLTRQGCRLTSYRSIKLPLAESIKRPGIRREFLRVRINEFGQLQSHPNQSSGMMSSSCWAEGFAVIIENTCPQAGDQVEFIPFTHLLQLPETLLDIE